MIVKNITAIVIRRFLKIFLRLFLDFHLIIRRIRFTRNQRNRKRGVNSKKRRITSFIFSAVEGIGSITSARVG
jgi:hypothetical protein